MGNPANAKEGARLADEVVDEAVAEVVRLTDLNGKLLRALKSLAEDDLLSPAHLAAAHQAIADAEGKENLRRWVRHG